MELRKELRDITLSRLQEYVETVEDAVRNGEGFSGDGWDLELTELPPVRLGSLRSQRVSFVLRGDEASVNRVWDSLQYKLLRGGA
jgi:hypothetical protein